MTFADVGSLLFSIAAIVAVLYGCYKFSKFMAKKVNNVTNSNNIKIIERVALTQDKGLLIVEVCQKFYLISFANNNIEILKELDETDLHIQKSVPLKQSFFDALNSAFKSRTDLKTSDKGDKIDEIDYDANHKEDD